MSVYERELSEIRSALSQFAKVSRNFEEEIEQAQRNYNPDAFREFSKAKTEEFQKAKSQYSQRVSELCDKLTNKIRKYWQPDTRLYKKDAVEMLESPYFSFTLRDLNQMATEQYADNPTMLQVLHAYAKKNQLFSDAEGVASPLLYADEKVKIQNAEEIKKALISAIGFSDQAAVRTMADKFDTIFNAGLTAIGEL